MTATMPTVRERPVLMTGPMVRAILDGRKSQTRRPLKPQPDGGLDFTPGPVTHFQRLGIEVRTGRSSWGAVSGDRPINAFRVGRDSIKDDIECPYGAPLDRLWVRETWQDWCPLWSGAWCGCGSKEMVAETHRPAYRATPDERGEPKRWRPAIHMPRWASRITLEITDIRVERVQDISEDDARAEGARRFDDIPDSHPYGQGGRWSMGRPASSDECLGSARFAFANLWNALNAARGLGWDENPWCWVISFRRVTP
ncbi:MAG TPA: hypothetical protein VFS44_02310 [Gemmatimonadaceae bacterium]|nr:hypothetical protein [Gemmatimonadaceae bacterium]